jgi:hypothetical protein
MNSSFNIDVADLHLFIALSLLYRRMHAEAKPDDIGLNVEVSVFLK